MKTTLLIILLTLAIVLIPSLLIAGGLAVFIGHFWVFFAIAFAVIFIIGQISNVFFQHKAGVDVERLRARLTEITNQQSVEVSCSYCKERNLVPIRLDKRNIFECKSCKQTNLVIFQFATAQITTPLENPQLGTIGVPNGQQQQQRQPPASN